MPRRVEAGESITLELPALDADVEEMEVLLSLDDGRTWPYRITQDRLDAGTLARWEVPNLSCAAARVRLRYRVAGREQEGPPSDAFVIVADLTRALEHRLPREEAEAHELERHEHVDGSLATRRGPLLHLPDAEFPAAPSDDGNEPAPRAAARLPLNRPRIPQHRHPLLSRTAETFTPLRN
jgi:hypothetical protein